MTTTTTRLEVLAMARAAARCDEETADSVWRGSDDQGSLVGAMASLLAHILRVHFGADVDGTVDWLISTRSTHGRGYVGAARILLRAPGDALLAADAC